MKTRLFGLLDRHALHPTLRENGPDLRYRAYLAVVFAVLSGLGACALGLNHLLFGIAAEGALFIAFGLSAFMAITLLRRTGSLVLVGNVVAALWFGAMIASTAARGGLMSHGSMGVAAVPVVAVVLAGRLSGLFWCLMSLGLIGTLFGLESSGIELVDRAPPDARAVIALISAVLFALLLYFMAAAHEGMKSAAIAELAWTERAKLEAEAEARLHEADRLAAVSRLSAAVAHEINNPLTYILGNVGWVREDLLSGGPFDRAEAAEALAEVLEGAERVRVIVQDLSTFSRGEEKVRAVELDGAISSALRMVSHQLGRRATVRRELHTDSPVLANSAHLGRVLLDLLINAAHAIPEGRAEDNEIAVIAYDDGPFVAIEIRDTGIGIPARDLERAVEPFYTTREVGEGAGLGLAVSKNIVERLGGRLELESLVGEGTTARILLRRGSGRAAERKYGSDTHHVRPSQARRVLLVEDDPRVIAHIERMLSGHELATALDGRVALELLARDSDFDVIVCDLMMPEVTGMAVYEQLRERKPELAARFIAMTGGAFSDDARAFLDSFDGPVVNKPFSARVLQRRVLDVPRRARRRSELAS